MINRKIPWTQQPQYPVEVDWSNPIASKFAVFTMPISGGVLRNFSREKVEPFAYKAGTIMSATPGPLGLGVGSDTNSGGNGSYRLNALANQTDTAWESPRTAGTWFACVIRTGSGANNNAQIIGNQTLDTSPGPGWGIYDYGTTAHALKIACATNGVAFEIISAANTIPLGVPALLVGRYDGSKLAGFVNGVKVTEGNLTGTITYTNSATRGPAIGDFYNFGGNLSFQGKNYLSGVSPLALTDAEIKSLFDNQWQIFQAPARKLWISGASGIPTLSSPGMINLTQTTGTPQVTLTF